MKRLCWLVCLILVFWANSIGAISKNFELKTTLSSSSENFYNIMITQKINFYSSIEKFCPITQFPKNLTLTFKSIGATLVQGKETTSFCTDDDDPYKAELQQLKKLIGVPIHIELNKDLTLKTPPSEFIELIKLANLENSFISSDLLEQIIELLVIPQKAQGPSKNMPLTIHYPFKATIHSQYQLSAKGSQKHISGVNPLHLKDPFYDEMAHKALSLEGEIKLKADYSSQNPFPQKVFIEHYLEENAEKTLFENPLFFNHSISLTQKNCLKKNV